ncbi:MAG: hypothetical protein QOJ84_3537 [Bradyrhizobium sp.]|jgi:hypothetical protein|nr:hypothetical protein [Bradyrhizobium sp.]
MTTTAKARDSAEIAAQPRRRYGDDLYGWVEDQIALLKAGRLSEIDADNIAEELSDVGNEQYDKLESAIRVVLLHLLKWDHQPSHRSKSWVLSIREHRRRIDRVLRKNPSLKPSIEEAMDEAYENARDDAMRETDLPKTAFPTKCAYDWETILKRAIEFDDLRSPEG